MAYSFAGYFSKAKEIPASMSSGDHVWRRINEPFQGIGVCIPEWHDEQPSTDKIIAQAREIGFGGDDWIFLIYECWAGGIESVYAYGNRGGNRFGPIEEGDDRLTEAAYVRAMAEFGLTREQAMRFTPFGRGFWNEDV